jgi:hypothetical protein
VSYSKNNSIVGDRWVVEMATVMAISSSGNRYGGGDGSGATNK